MVPFIGLSYWITYQRVSGSIRLWVPFTRYTTPQIYIFLFPFTHGFNTIVEILFFALGQT